MPRKKKAKGPCHECGKKSVLVFKKKQWCRSCLTRDDEDYLAEVASFIIMPKSSIGMLLSNYSW